MSADESLASSPSTGDANPPSLLATLVAHYDELVDQVYRRFGRRGMAHEVVHDAWLHLRRRTSAHTAVHAPLGLLRRIVHHLAIDECRREDAHRQRVTAMDTLPETISTQPSAEQILAARQALAALAVAIEQLPPRCREVFILHKIHDLPQAEVADILQISVKTVEKHVRNGMLACRRCLAAWTPQ